MESACEIPIPIMGEVAGAKKRIGVVTSAGHTWGLMRSRRSVASACTLQLPAAASISSDCRGRHGGGKKMREGAGRVSIQKAVQVKRH